MLNLKKLQPPWTKSGQVIESAVRKALYDFKMIEEKNITIALSGGKDSLTLLLMLKAISQRGFDFNIQAVHVSGSFSCGPGVATALIQEICDFLKVPLTIVESQQTLSTLECYSCSRKRRTLLFEAAQKAGSSLIAFGHHRDDQAQTLMLNMLHKGEFASMLPKLTMHRYQVTLIRPLIYLSEDQITGFAKQCGFQKILCQCPVGQNSMRQKIKQMLYDLETLFPNARSNIADIGLKHGSDKATKDPL